MNRPNPKDYQPKDFIRGTYEEDLEKYIDYLEQVKKELETTETLLADRQKLLDAIPECDVHGRCVPHALEWIEKMKAQNLPADNQ